MDREIEWMSKKRGRDGWREDEGGRKARERNCWLRRMMAEQEEMDG